MKCCYRRFTLYGVLICACLCSAICGVVLSLETVKIVMCSILIKRVPHHLQLSSWSLLSTLLFTPLYFSLLYFNVIFMNISSHLKSPLLSSPLLSSPSASSHLIPLCYAFSCFKRLSLTHSSPESMNIFLHMLIDSFQMQCMLFTTVYLCAYMCVCFSVHMWEGSRSSGRMLLFAV